MTSAPLETLLLVQERDLALDRLRHRRATLPERTELEQALAERAARDREAGEIRAQRDKVLAEERRLDDESRSLGEKAAEAEKTLYGGTISSPRELQALQADVEMLKRRRSELEDQELEIMEDRERLDADLDTIDRNIADLDATMARLQTTIAEAEAEIDAEAATEAAARAELAAGVGASLLADYERRRAQNRGAGAARLVGTTCQACHLSIPSTEAERIRRGDGATAEYCDNCGAILVP